MKSMLSGIVIAFVVGLVVSPSSAQNSFDESLMDVDLQKDEALILVTIQDRRGNPMPGVVLNVQQGFRGKQFNKVSDDSGKVKLVVRTGYTYEITFLSLTSEKGKHKEVFEIADEPEQRYTLVMTYDEAMAKEFVLEGVTFATGTARLQSSSFSRLQPLVDYMKLKPEIYVELSGHTDNQGDPEENLNLSEARAEAVRQYLIKQGIDGNRIAATGYGDQRPIAPNNNAKGRQKNRRTEVRIVE
ncbi:MAG: OmpA family protein [Deltaproteobacteria bacterium]|nr:OmpA family protein [Deltaproteobacteria bacterium]MBN2672313.1 OmpA family protein [Deltaproteobacteria bacterium]